jgi:S-disulfanyl-L-cysteine oxidoreductase SoxD
VRTFALALVTSALILLISCKATGPGGMESTLATEAKKVAIGGKDWKNPAPDTQDAINEGRGHFQHHCQICHGLDGHGTGVPFKDKMSPPVLDLGEKSVQDYSDGQLKWIISNGIRFTGMPGWSGILEDDEQWKIVRFLRHLPAPGSAGVPEIFKEEAEEHEQMEHGGAAGHEHGQAAPAGHDHSHPSGTPEHKH